MYLWPVYLYTDGTNDHLSFQNNLKWCHQANSLRVEGGTWHPPNSHMWPKKTVTDSMHFPRLFSKEGSVLKKINSWVPWSSYAPGIRGGKFTYCQMIIGFQQTLLLPEICTMGSEWREESFCNMFFLTSCLPGLLQGEEMENFNLWPYGQCMALSGSQGIFCF